MRNLFGPQATGVRAQAQAAALKNAARAALGLGDDDIVMLQELACGEVGCPPVEAVLAVLRPGVAPRQWKFHHTIADLTPEQVHRTVLGEHHG